MKETREALSEKEIKDAIIRIRNCGRFEENMIAVARKDLEYGLTKEEVDIYMKEGFSVGQMEKLSEAIRKHGSTFAASIAKEDLDEQSMKLAIDYYEKGISLENIVSGTMQKTSAYHLNQIYSCMLATIKQAQTGMDAQTVDADYMEKLLGEMKEIVLSINRNAERYDALSDKLRQAEIENKVQKEQSENHLKIALMEKEIEGLNDTIDELKKQLSEKEEEMEEMKHAEKQQITGEYVATFPGTGSQPSMKMVIEQPQPKRGGLYALMGKLAFKKKSNQDIVRLVAHGDLSTGQLSKIRLAMEKGLTEEQLLELVHSNATPEQMEEIIEIATLQNSTR